MLAALLLSPPPILQPRGTPTRAQPFAHLTSLQPEHCCRWWGLPHAAHSATARASLPVATVSCRNEPPNSGWLRICCPRRLQTGRAQGQVWVRMRQSGPMVCTES